MAYPIIIKASKRLVQEFQDCELGRFEDKSLDIERGEKGDWPDAVGYEILDRRKEGIEIQTEAELREIRWAIGSGTTSLFSWSMYRAACLLCKRLEQAAESLGVEFAPLELTIPESPEFAVGDRFRS